MQIGTACDLLSARGFNGNKLMAKLKMNRLPKNAVTQPHSKERIEALANAKSHGQRFLATGGGHLTTDDAFKAFELIRRREMTAAMEKEKLLWLTAEQVEEDALAILESESMEEKKLKVPELRTVLLFYGIERKKQGKKVNDLRDQLKKLREKILPQSNTRNGAKTMN